MVSIKVTRNEDKSYSTTITAVGAGMDALTEFAVGAADLVAGIACEMEGEEEDAFALVRTLGMMIARSIPTAYEARKKELDGQAGDGTPTA